jgi:hypothetical protein
MIAVKERPVAGVAKPPLPREHGAWGILLIPYAIAVGVTGVFDWKQGLLLASVVLFYLARTSWLKRQGPWTWLLLGGSVACAAPLLVVWKLGWLAAFGAVAVLVAFRKTTHNLTLQLTAVAGLTLTAPVADYVATLHLRPEALKLWLLNVLYFAGGVLYVKMHIATAMARRPTGRWPVVVYYGALLGGLAWWPVGLAFVPAIARALVGAARVSPVLRIRRLGWTEVGHSLVFAGLAIWLLRP